jgi:hypothetical protein
VNQTAEKLEAMAIAQIQRTRGNIGNLLFNVLQSEADRHLTWASGRRIRNRTTIHSMDDLVLTMERHLMPGEEFDP